MADSELFVEYQVVNSAATTFGSVADVFKGVIPTIQQAGDNLDKSSLIGQTGDASLKGLEALLPAVNQIIAQMQEMQKDMLQAITDYQGTDAGLKTT
ncbi:MAG TPA: WXG100 family type VII secretion target [Aggregatilineales bacterium]|nr:WXG100 family type VII secretion target [Aggregatilineales bacterium]